MNIFNDIARKWEVHEPRPSINFLIFSDHFRGLTMRDESSGDYAPRTQWWPLGYLGATEGIQKAVPRCR